MKNDKTTELNNLKMNDEVYALRRKVIALVYEAKRICPSLPRITVRVTENAAFDSSGRRTIGLAKMGECVIWITRDFVADRSTVFHEILHAAFGVKHVDSCPLMGPVDKKISDATANELFKHYCQKHTGRVV